MSAEQAEALVTEAEAAGETVVLVEIDPREGSGVIPNNWTAALGARGTQRSSAGIINPDLRKLPALAGGARRTESSASLSPSANSGAPSPARTESKSKP